MVDKRYLLALDEGTTSARAIIFDEALSIRGIGQEGFKQYYPRPGWVEQDAEAVWDAQLRSIKKAIRDADLYPGDIGALGVANQRETTVIWEKASGRPVYNAVVWQCRRTTEYTELLKEEYGDFFKQRTGLIPDSYFSGPKAAWILDSDEQLRRRAERGELLFGTMDSYLIYKLTRGKVHATDCSNASRTMMFNIHTLEWDDELLEVLRIPEAVLPEVKPSSALYGYADGGVLGASIPIHGVMGDQQSALFGHNAHDEGQCKCTYGTGNFLLMNTGEKPASSRNLLTTVAWGYPHGVTYALEGSVFVTGAAVQWLRDSMGMIRDGEESVSLAASIEDNDGVYFVPALTGLGAPYWDQYARGILTGITRGTSRAHVVRAVLESIAYLTRDVVKEMEKDSGIRIKEMKVDGGASRNEFLMQFQADILGIPVIRPSSVEMTARGAALMAGLDAGFWGSVDELREHPAEFSAFTPEKDRLWRKRQLEGWEEALRKSFSHI